MENRFIVGITLVLSTVLVYSINIPGVIFFSAGLVLHLYDNYILYNKLHRIRFPYLVLFVYSILGLIAITYHYVYHRNKGLIVVFSVTTSDILQYYVGKHLGRTSIGFPSPNKTIEGYVIGAALAIILNKYTYGYTIWISLYLVLLGVMGDIFVSINKRLLGIKDISNMLGQHGGLLDRTDGMYYALIASMISTLIWY
jgi:phosphatidate cytidylyltransferase